MITVDVMDLLLALLGVAGLILIIYLVMTLSKLQQTLKEANRLISEVRGPVNDTIRKLPMLMDQISEIGDNVEKLTDSINEDVPAMLKDVRQVTTSARDSVDAVGGAVTEVGSSVKNMFTTVNAHSGSIGTATAIAGEVFRLFQMFRRPRKKTLFGKRRR